MVFNFTATANSLIVAIDTEAGEYQGESYTYFAPSFKLSNDKIRIFESGTYKDAFTFEHIGTIGGTTPTDLNDAFVKLYTLIENFSSGGVSPQPNLAQVLTQQDRPVKLIPTNPYTFELGDHTKLVFSTYNPDTDNYILDMATAFPNFAVIKFQSFFVDSILTCIGNGVMSYNGQENLTYISIPKGAFCELKKFEFGAWVLNIVPAASIVVDLNMSLSKIISRCSDNAFRNAHASLIIGEAQFYGTRTTPPRAILFPNIDNLSIFSYVDFPNSYGSIEYFAYNATAGKIYACVNTKKIIVFNDITDLSDYTIVDITLSGGVTFGASSVVMTDNTYIYIGTAETPQANFIKILISDYSVVSVTPWIGDDSSSRDTIHSGCWNLDKTELYFHQNGAICHGAKINPSDMSYVDYYAGTSITDDITFIPYVSLSEISFDAFIYSPAENRQKGMPGGYLTNTSTLETFPISAMRSTGCYWDMTTERLYVSNSDGFVQVWEGVELLKTAYGYTNPDIAYTLYAELNGNWLNEINLIGNRIFVTCWNNSTDFGADGKGALLEVNLVKVPNGAMTKIESTYLNQKDLKYFYSDSVVAVSDITISGFTTGDFEQLYGKYIPTIVAKNYDSAQALIGSWISNSVTGSFKLNFAAPVTASLEYDVIIKP